MLKRLCDWLDHRTGYRKLISAMLLEHIPGGAKWRYVWGSALAIVFSVQLITGILLMTAYSAGDSTAWSSVYYIQYEMDFGWFIRGLHHFGSQTMVVLMAIHMLQVVIAGAQMAPREINWWLGLLLMGVVLGLSLTGYLLPWDQKGYYATQVATNIAGSLPIGGAFIQKIIIGGTAYGHHTLTRFYALHVGILPPLLIVLMIMHIVVFRRHGITTPPPEKLVGKPGGWFWPDQAFRDIVVGLLVIGVMVGMVVFLGHGQKIDGPGNQFENADSFYEKWAHAGQNGMGANLDAPADPATENYPARPEWYFLFLFQLLKYFKGDLVLIGTVVIPNVVVVLLFLLPLLGYGRMRKFGHVFGVLVVSVLLLGVAVLTGVATYEDANNKEFQEDRRKAEIAAHRAVNLAREGIPAEGAVELLRRDPMTTGKKLFETNCAVCHHSEKEGKQAAALVFTLNMDGKEKTVHWGSEEWIRGLLREPDSKHYFGGTEWGGMTRFVKNARRGARRDADLPDDFKGEPPQLKKDFDSIAHWLGKHPTRTPEEGDPAEDMQGFRAFETHCTDCHSFAVPKEDLITFTAPDLTGYGGDEWLRTMILAPTSATHYRTRNRMPVFRPLEGDQVTLTRQGWDEHVELFRLKNVGPLERELEALKSELSKATGEDAENLKQDIKDKEKEIEDARKVISDATNSLQHLSNLDRELIIRYVTNDGRVVFGGKPLSGPPKKKE